MALLVLDLTRLLPGPLAAKMLASLGFRVLRMEPPQGDFVQSVAPDLYQWLNAGKEIERLDLKTPAGKERLITVAGEAQVLLETNLPGVMERLQVGPEVLRAFNPGLVYVRMAGYRDPRQKTLPGHDLTYLAASGLLSGLDSAWTRMQLADLCGAFWAVIAALDGIRQGGGFFEVYLGDAAMTAAYPQPPALSGCVVCYGIYSTAEGNIALAALEPTTWKRFCEAISHPDWLQQGFSPAAPQNAIYRELCDLFRTRTAAEWDAWAVSNSVCLRAIQQYPQPAPMPPWSRS
jgi:alpha-methylacyl-CoA racemase